MCAQIVFRVDASPEIGGGHVMRCLALAHAMSERQAECAFLAAAGSAETVPALARAGFPVFTADGLSTEPPSEFGAHWRDGVECVVVDHYGVDAVLERHFRAWAGSVVVIDDLANRRHDCDLLIDQTFGHTAAAYRSLVPAGCKVLAGTDYALLRSEFAAARPAALARRAVAGPVRRILVALGLTDLGGVTARMLRTLLALELGCAIDVVLGGCAPSVAEVLELAQANPDVAAHVDVGTPEMVLLMAEADLAIGAGGTSTWERCCLGLPAVLLTLAENQTEIAARLARAGAAWVIAGGTSFDAHGLAEAAGRLVHDPGERLKMARRAARVCNGRGSQRVALAFRRLSQQSNQSETAAGVRRPTRTGVARSDNREFAPSRRTS